MIENNRRLGLVDFRIDVAELENVRLHRFGENLLSEFEDAFLVGSRGDHEADWKIIRTRERRWHDRKHLDAGNPTELCLDLWQVRLGRSFANAPWLQHHSAEPVVREGQLKGESSVRDVLKDFPCSIGVTDRVVD